MSVYLGTFGEVELKREFDGSDLRSTINPSDVNATKKRFSFDFDHGQLLTGDQVEITSTDGSALDFIDNYTKTSVKKFIYVDELDGIRLYDSFAHAVVGGTTNATALAAPANNIPIKVVVQNSDYRVLGRVQSYELNTQRETVDVTTLSDEFRNRIGTLMSGSGRMACEWEYTGDTTKELPNYLLELVLRTKVGSTFKGRFYIKTSGYNPANHSDASNDAVWYEVSGVLTACAVQFTPNQMVQITADFITTSKIEIRMDLEVVSNMLQEDNASKILLDQGTTDAILLDP
jgi:hypothetical protein|tara:strand:+ start:408 stop:1274 length:867 start_codon:yes stop_codon:yes gene_type:complete